MRYVAFLRAINVGGRNITMAELRELFEGMGLGSVDTFIASGNVIFESKKKPDRLEKLISAGLRESLGYPVPTFLRTLPELVAVTGAQPFEAEVVSAAAAYNVAFTENTVTTEQRSRLAAFRTQFDDFAAIGREIFWICRVRQSESRFANAAMERSLGTSVTWRGINTVRRLVARYG